MAGAAQGVSLRGAFLQRFRHRRHPRARRVGTLVCPATPGGCGTHGQLPRPRAHGAGGSVRSRISRQKQRRAVALDHVARCGGRARRPRPTRAAGWHGCGHYRPPRSGGRAARFRGQVKHHLPHPARPRRHCQHERRTAAGSQPGLVRPAGPAAPSGAGPHFARAEPVGHPARTHPATARGAAQRAGAPVAHACAAPGWQHRVGAHLGSARAHQRARRLCVCLPRHDGGRAHQRGTPNPQRPAAASWPPGKAGRLGARPDQGAAVLVRHVLRDPRSARGNPTARKLHRAVCGPRIPGRVAPEAPRLHRPSSRAEHGLGNPARRWPQALGQGPLRGGAGAWQGRPAAGRDPGH